MHFNLNSTAMCSIRLAIVFHDVFRTRKSFGTRNETASTMANGIKVNIVGKHLWGTSRTNEHHETRKERQMRFACSSVSGCGGFKLERGGQVNISRRVKKNVDRYIMFSWLSRESSKPLKRLILNTAKLILPLTIHSPDPLIHNHYSPRPSPKKPYQNAPISTPTASTMPNIIPEIHPEINHMSHEPLNPVPT
jgi:hypothetical protein